MDGRGASLNHRSEVIVFMALFFALALPSAALALQIDFVAPTEPDGYVIDRNYTYVNVSVNDAGPNLTAFLDWNRSLVGWWRLNNETGENSTFFRDWSGWGNNGTCSGTACPATTAPGKFGNASQFTDSEDDHINVSDSASLNPTQEISLEAWIYNDGANNCKAIIDKNRDAAYSLHVRCAADQRLRMQGVFGGSGQTLDSNSSTLSNVWTHVAGTYNGSETRLYINGTLEASGAVTGLIGVSSEKLRIGRAHDFGPWKGRIDEVRVWKRALSEQEIRASYNASRYGIERNFTGLALGAYTYRAYSQNATGYVNNTGLRTLNVVADATPPAIYASSPANQSYSSQSIWFNLTLNENASWCGVSMDGGSNRTLTNSSGNWNFMNSSVPDGPHSALFHCNDTSGNFNSSITVYFTVGTATTPTPTPTPTATVYGGGGGGGGGGDGTLAGGVETYQIGRVPAGGTAKFTIQKQASLGVTEVTIEAKTAIADGAKITIERLDGKPSAISSDLGTGVAYGYLEISLSNNANESVSKAVIGFRVEKSWISAGNYSGVGLYRWRDGGWQELSTRLAAEDETYNYYNAESPGLSFFAVTGFSSSARPIKATPTPVRTPTKTPPPPKPAEKPWQITAPNATLNVTRGIVTNVTKAAREYIETVEKKVNPAGLAITVVMFSLLLWMAINSALPPSRIYQHMAVGMVLGGIILWILAFRPVTIPVKSLIAAGALGLILVAYIILAKGGISES